MLSILSNKIFRLFIGLSKYISPIQNLLRLLGFFSSSQNKHTMNVFGTALEDYYSKNMKSKFVYYRNCLQKEFNGYKNEYDLGIYFRNWDNLFPLEKKLIEYSFGNILDIGSCTGYYVPYLMEKGTVTGIEISPKVNKIAHKKGINNCVTGDFLTYKFNKLFDTITFVGNDIALSGTLRRLRKFMIRCGELLTDNGQVLLIFTNVRTLKYWQVVFTPHYNGQFGIPFKLLFLNINFFKKKVAKYGFQSTVLGEGKILGNLSYLVKLNKSSKEK